MCAIQASPVTGHIDNEQDAVFIEGPVKGEYLAGLEFEENLDNFRSPKKQQQSLCEIADSSDGLVYIARFKNIVVGYVTFHNPDPYTRWCRLPVILELGAIEISRLWRKQKIGYRLMQHAFSNPKIEEHIVITMEYCWHWDVDGSGLNIWSYQKMLTRLFGSVGLQKVSTNDPEIMEHPANVLMARIGKNVSAGDIEKFDSLRFEKG